MCSTRPIAYACPPEVERPPIRVYCAGSYDDYPQALAEITRLMGEHAQRVGLDIETRSGDG